MPIGFAQQFSYWTALIVPLLFYIFISIEMIAEEIEDPFGKDENDLPTMPSMRPSGKMWMKSSVGVIPNINV